MYAGLSVTKLIYLIFAHEPASSPSSGHILCIYVIRYRNHNSAQGGTKVGRNHSSPTLPHATYHVNNKVQGSREPHPIMFCVTSPKKRGVQGKVYNSFLCCTFSPTALEPETFSLSLSTWSPLLMPNVCHQHHNVQVHHTTQLNVQCKNILM